MQKRESISLTCLSLAILLLYSWTGRSEEDTVRRNLASLLPPDTICMIQLHRAPELLKEAQKGPFWEELQAQPWKNLIHAFQTLDRPKEEAFFKKAWSLLPRFSGSMAAAIWGSDLEEETVGAAVILELEDEGEQEEVMEELLALTKLDKGDGFVSAQSPLGFSARINMEGKGAFARHGRTIILATRYSDVVAIVRNIITPEAPTLSTTKRYLSLSKTHPPGGWIEFYFDVECIVRRASADHWLKFFLQDRLERLGPIEAVLYTLSASNGSFVEAFHADLIQDEHSPLSSHAFEKQDPSKVTVVDPADRIPTEAIVYRRFKIDSQEDADYIASQVVGHLERMDPLQQLTKLFQAIETANPDKEETEADSDVDGGKKDVGVDEDDSLKQETADPYDLLRKELTDWLRTLKGPQTAWIQAPGVLAEGGMPAMGGAFHCGSAKNARGLVERISKFFARRAAPQPALSEERIGAQSIIVLDVAAVVREYGPLEQLRQYKPCWCAVGEHFALADCPESLKTQIAVLEKKHPALTSAPRYRNAVAEMDPTQKPAIAFYVDVRSALRWGLSMAKPALQKALQAESEQLRMAFDGLPAPHQAFDAVPASFGFLEESKTRTSYTYRSSLPCMAAFVGGSIGWMYWHARKRLFPTQEEEQAQREEEAREKAETETAKSTPGKGARRRLAVRKSEDIVSSTTDIGPLDKGLNWLVKVQEEDGRWNARQHGSRIEADRLSTMFAVLSFLGAGHTERVGEHKETVGRALRWLRSVQKEDGSFFDADYVAGPFDYFGANGIACLALSAASSMAWVPEVSTAASRSAHWLNQVIVSDNEELPEWHRRAILNKNIWSPAFLAQACNSARVAGLGIDEECLESLNLFLLAIQQGEVGKRWFGFPNLTPGENAKHTAAAVATANLIGWSRGMVTGSESFLARNGSPSIQRWDIFHLYFGTQAQFNSGGEEWRDWNEAMKNLLSSHQEQDGAWKARGELGETLGDVVTTALACMTLEIYYRYLPSRTESSVSDFLEAYVSPELVEKKAVAAVDSEDGDDEEDCNDRPRNPEEEKRVHMRRIQDARMSALDGLEWLASIQETDGSWASQKHGAPVRIDLPVTALATLAFLRAGQTEQRGLFSEAVRKALAWLRATSKGGNGYHFPSDGSYRFGDAYGAALAGWALIEAYRGERCETNRSAAKQALDFIERQLRKGAEIKAGTLSWADVARRKNDFRMILFLANALDAGRQAGMKVDKEACEGGLRFLAGVQQTIRAQGRTFTHVYGMPGRRLKRYRNTAFGVAARMLLDPDSKYHEPDPPGFILEGGCPYSEHCYRIPRVDLLYAFAGSAGMRSLGADPLMRWQEATIVNIGMSREWGQDNENLGGSGAFEMQDGHTFFLGSAGMTAWGVLCLVEVLQVP